GAMGAGAAGGQSEMGVSNEVLESLKKQYGFDKPMHIRYAIWLKNIVTLDFGESFSYEEPVVDVIASKFPVSLQFGIISLLLTYMVCIPLGIAKAVRDGSTFDMASSVFLMFLYSIPPLILAILLRVYLAGGAFLDWFPLGDLYSDNYFDLGLWDQIKDRIHHFILPLICYVVGNFTVLTFLMKNSLIEEIKLDYVRTARAKGLPEKVVYYKHALRNALIPIATGMASFLGFFFAGSVIIEQVFNLDGMGLLSYKAALDRDYNVIMGLIFFQSLLMLLGRFLSDISYTLIDPRIDFS
ncbi:MAG: ABC transporter permease subunit, partial [Bdellovibrionales bacterium]|nr:ABC transporter permease subunit [Bdellovibrionales bacterium]